MDQAYHSCKKGDRDCALRLDIGGHHEEHLELLHCVGESVQGKVRYYQEYGQRGRNNGLGFTDGNKRAVVLPIDLGSSDDVIACE